MVKQIIFLLVVSALAIYFMKEVTAFLHYIGTAQHYLVKKLSLVFAGGKIGILIRQSLALALVPLVAGLIPGSIYYAIKRQQMPYLYHLVWVVWLMLMTSMVLHK